MLGHGHPAAIILPCTVEGSVVDLPSGQQDHHTAISVRAKDEITLQSYLVAVSSGNNSSSLNITSVCIIIIHKYAYSDRKYFMLRIIGKIPQL